jgi:hypothetical protein
MQRSSLHLFKPSQVQISSKNGFSLIETLLALTVGMALLMGATFYLYSITQSYFKLQEDPRFEDHAESLCAMLENLVGTTRKTPVTEARKTDTNAQSASPKPSELQTRRKGKGDLRWEAPPGIMADMTLAFKPQVNPIFFSALPGPTFDFDGYLCFIPKEGLFLAYQTSSTKKEDPNAVSIFLLSPWVSALEYGFFDAESGEWSFSAQPPSKADDANPLLPQALRLKLEWEGRDATRLIFL